jgi:hypothetical protein
MKTFVLLLTLIVTTAWGAEPFAFPIEGAVKIENATYFLNGDRTGGSVSVIIRDSKGTQSFVYYMTADVDRNFGGGLLTFRAKEGAKGTTFPHASKDEARLLNYLRAACVASFGSSDPDFLRDPRKGVGLENGFSMMAMGSLLRHFPTQAEKVAPSGGDKPSK